ncbi:DUF2507 domain-containing protein [Weissella koreensis]|uniref:DUF2507 domain-containing protein n=1 Tax=Weissella koreensis TaxID=165096 RepID=A0A7H1MN26_9LACO|nr:DUF2507 domain-containing protein [Weissella koreensis]AEJ24044.1 hypothetical protein WKK_05870 [Weissella koreensis KACC 15510]AVH75658.1 DUF2507 domain-containing protein [Weissella koreensis]EJF34645.1 hypothetical protein JC2156_14860 [Weissella koreensis KCTC 3621]MCZ9311372.1 DUF2507 domain-containing protein [Weissella koreensis]QGN20881.1 DUF2507 domain-containing protein [Weissella koreensis]
MADQNNNIFPITLLRDHLLPDLLTDDLSDITYWAGKNLAREFPLKGISAVINFFNDAGFGTLNIESQKATSQKWFLTGSLVETRMTESSKPDFFLEAGFLAQQTEQQIGSSAEAQVEFDKDTVIFTVLTIESAHMDE